MRHIKPYSLQIQSMAQILTFINPDRAKKNSNSSDSGNNNVNLSLPTKTPRLTVVGATAAPLAVDNEIDPSANAPSKNNSEDELNPKA
jgi:hypothetical protein